MPKSLSECSKKGEPPSHINAGNDIYWTIKYYFEETPLKLSCQCYPDWEEIFDDTFQRHHKLGKYATSKSGRTYTAHYYDRVLGFYCKVAENSTIRYTFRIFRFIEIGDIGDDTKHNPGHPDQLINDGVAKSWVEYKHPWAQYIKVNKDDCAYGLWLVKKLKLNTICDEIQMLSRQ